MVFKEENSSYFKLSGELFFSLQGLVADLVKFQHKIRQLNWSLKDYNARTSSPRKLPKTVRA